MILIDMNMPTSCEECPFGSKGNIAVGCKLSEYAWAYSWGKGKLPNCPLHEVTDSDTISRQTAYDTLTEYYHHKTEVQHKALAEALSRVPSSQLANKSPKVAKEFGELISRQMAIDAVEESRRLNHHQDGKAACAHEYEHRHFLKLLRDLPSVQPEPPWIPCSNQLPEGKQEVLVTEYGDTDIGRRFEGRWLDRYGDKMKDVTAWMPKPEPYHRP